MEPTGISPPLQVPLAPADAQSRTAPLSSGGFTEGLRAGFRCLAPRPAALLAFVVVLLAFLLVRAVMQWQIGPERRAWVAHGAGPGA
jgi:hypothetical protein